jgi:hypothetical protein
MAEGRVHVTDHTASGATPMIEDADPDLLAIDTIEADVVELDGGIAETHEGPVVRVRLGGSLPDGTPVKSHFLLHPTDASSLAVAIALATDKASGINP